MSELINLFNQKKVDSLQLDTYLKWASNKIENSPILALPPIQRGFVWKPYQIQQLWDSLLREMPIGAVMLQKFSEQKGMNLTSDTSRKLEGVKDGYFLLDGQQRTLSMLLGRYGSETHKLWIDFSEDGLNGSLYRFRVTTKYQPFGYTPDGKGRLSLSDRRNAYEYWKKVKNIKEEDFFEKVKPWKASDKEGKYIYEVKDLFENNESIFFDEKIKEKVNSFVDKLKELKKQWIPLILVPHYKINESIKEHINDPLTLLFERISTNGTRLTSEDLLFSMIKQEWPEAHNLVNDLQEKVGCLLKPTDFIMTAFRISILLRNNDNTSEKEIPDNPKPNAKYFHTHLNKILNFEKPYGLKLFIKTDKEKEEFSEFVEAFKILIDAIKYNSDNKIGIPKVMLPKLDKYLIQILVYFILHTKSYEKEDLIRFILFWMANMPDSKTSQKNSQVVIELINKGKALKEIYQELINKDQSENNYKLYKIKKYYDDTSTPDKEEKLHNINDRAIYYFGEEGKDFYHKFSTNIELLLWFQREYINENKNIISYEPLAIHDEDSVPYDYDHLVPQSNWSSLSKNGNSLEKITNKTNKNNFTDLWCRRHLGNLIGNYRVLESSENRSRGDKALTEEIENDKNVFVSCCINEDNCEAWKKASPKDKSREWNDERLQSFQYVVEKRTLNLYNQLLNQFKDWNE